MPAAATCDHAKSRSSPRSAATPACSRSAAAAGSLRASRPTAIRAISLPLAWPSARDGLESADSTARGRGQRVGRAPDRVGRVGLDAHAQRARRSALHGARAHHRVEQGAAPVAERGPKIARAPRGAGPALQPAERGEAVHLVVVGSTHFAYSPSKVVQTPRRPRLSSQSRRIRSATGCRVSSIRCGSPRQPRVGIERAAAAAGAVASVEYSDSGCRACAARRSGESLGEGLACCHERLVGSHLQRAAGHRPAPAPGCTRRSTLQSRQGRYGFIADNSQQAPSQHRCITTRLASETEDTTHHRHMTSVATRATR